MRHRITGRIVGIAVVVAMLSSLAVGAALAGSFTSDIIGAQIGFNSRNWSRTSTTSYTTIEFDYCHDNSDPYLQENTDVALWHVYSWAPDEYVTTRHFECWHSDVAHSYGIIGSGTYHFTIANINNGGQSYGLDVDSLEVQY